MGHDPIPGSIEVPNMVAGSGRLLVVDNDRSILDLLSTTLTFVGYEVSTTRSGLEALAAAQLSQADLVILDVMLADLDGFEVTRQLRALGHPVPVLFLSARGQLSDKIMGLSIGGDDYITKPFRLEELVVRIRALLRRSRIAAREHWPEDPSTSNTRVLRFMDLELDDATRDVQRRGHAITLSPTEFRLLRYLMMNADKVVSRSQIIEHVWRQDFSGNENIVESYISMLRRKIDSVDPALIHTLRGAGYSLRLPRS